MRKRRTFGVLAIVGAVAIPATAHATELTSVDVGATLPGPVEYAQDDPTFYEAPNPIPAGEHGDLVRWQVLESSFDRLYRIMYLSQTVAGAPTVVTGLVSVPDDIAPFGGFRKLLYGHGTTGMADSCAPSMAIDNDSAYGDYDGEFHSVSGTAGDAWVTVATDYEGVGGPGPHPFIVGVSEGRSMLDAGRAAGQIPGVYLSDTTAITGFSQGGHAALWATKLAGEWAPEQTIVGTVVGAPASDPAALASWAASQPQLSALSVGLVAGMATTYPEAQGALGQVLTPAGIALDGGVEHDPLLRSAGRHRRTVHRRRPRHGRAVRVAARGEHRRNDSDGCADADLPRRRGRTHPGGPQRGPAGPSVCRRTGRRTTRAAGRIPRQQWHHPRCAQLAQRRRRWDDDPGLQLLISRSWRGPYTSRHPR